MNDELEWLWKEAVIVCIKVLSWHLLGEIEGKHENPQSG
jgi:hypothetical protein